MLAQLEEVNDETRRKLRKRCRNLYMKVTKLAKTILEKLINVNDKQTQGGSLHLIA